MAVDLSDLDLAAEFGIVHVPAAERNVFAEHGRARGAGDDAHLGAPGAHAVAVGGGLVARELEADQPRRDATP